MVLIKFIWQSTIIIALIVGSMWFCCWVFSNRLLKNEGLDFLFKLLFAFFIFLALHYILGDFSYEYFKGLLLVNAFVVLLIAIIWLFFYFFAKISSFFYGSKEIKRVLSLNENFQDAVDLTDYIKVIDRKRLDSILESGKFYPFPDTGQKKCYDDEGEIICPQSDNLFFGQDAQHPRFPRSYTKLGHNGEELSKHAEHEYYGGSWIMTRDNITGLIWAIIPAAYNNKRMFFQSKINNEFISPLNKQAFGGYSDWRMPSIRELSSLINSDISDSESSTDRFWLPNIVPSSYWSSTLCDGDSNMNTAYLVDFSEGSVGISGLLNRGLALAVRCTHDNKYIEIIDNKDGTVSDPNMGLMWQCEHLPNQLYSWKEALAYSNRAQIAGYSDWRLPNRNELHSIVYYPVRYIDLFGPIYFWSSTTYTKNPKHVWLVDFNGKSAFHDKKRAGEFYGYVKLVRYTYYRGFEQL